MNADITRLHIRKVDAPSNADVSNYSTIKQSLTDAGFTDAILLQMVDNETTIEYAAQITGRTTQEITQIVDVLGIKKELTEYLNNLGSSAVLMNEEIIYALVATGSVTSFQGLKNISPKKLNSVIVSAIAQNIIPAQIADSIADIDDEWKDVYASFLSVAAEGPVDAKVLALGAFDDDNVERIVRNTYASNAHDLPSFWGELEENLKKEGYTPAPVVNRLELIFDVFQFADEFDLLAASIVNYLGKTDITHISELTSLEKEDWFNYIIDPITIDEKKGEEWPDDIPGETEEEKKSNYAKILFRRITTLFPMARFRHKLKNSTSYLWGHWDEIKTFLDNHPDFDFIEDINPVQISPQPDETLLGLLLMVQRIFRLTAQFEVIDGLLSRGYTSAVSIAHENGDDFVKKNEDITDGVDDAQTIYTAAVHTASQALFLMGTFNQQSDFDGESIPGVTEKLTPAPAIAPAPSLKNAVVAKMASQPILEAKSGQEDAPENGIRPVHPNIATLFGQQNQCLCPDCQSIFSPSAYLVDLLEFMGPETANVLFSRRPDLAETELSCRNTNGPVAYIDLVNEQLENAACTRTFFIQDNSNEDFAELLNQVLQSKLNIPQYVNEQFSIRGYPIDRNFYIQHKTGENRWYIVGDGWRYLVVEILKELPRRVFRITPFPQTGKNAQLRRALPEHTHRNAYILMKHLSFPWMMPFNLPYREVNQLLELRGSKRYRLHHILNETTDSFTLSETGLLQFFEMTSEQLDLIDNATPGKPWQLWGLHEQKLIIRFLVLK